MNHYEDHGYDEYADDEDYFEYVGFWPRVGATIIDNILIFLVTAPPVIAIFGWEYFVSTEIKPAELLISCGLPAVLTIAFWIYKQATPGKMAISAIIVDAKTLRPASTGQLIGRYFAYILSALPLGLGFIWVAFDKRKQGWHDKLAGTVVINRI